MCGDALLCCWVGTAYGSDKGPFERSRSGPMGRSLSGCCQLRQHCCLLYPLSNKCLCALLVHLSCMLIRRDLTLMTEPLCLTISQLEAFNLLSHRRKREEKIHHTFSLCWRVIVKLIAKVNISCLLCGGGKPL